MDSFATLENNVQFGTHPGSHDSQKLVAELARTDILSQPALCCSRTVRQKCILMKEGRSPDPTKVGSWTHYLHTHSLSFTEQLIIVGMIYFARTNRYTSERWMVTRLVPKGTASVPALSPTLPSRSRKVLFCSTGTSQQQLQKAHSHQGRCPHPYPHRTPLGSQAEMIG